MGVSFRRLIAVLLALSLLAACGGDGDDKDAVKTGDRSTTTAADDGDGDSDGSTTVTSGPKPRPVDGSGSGGSGGAGGSGSGSGGSAGGSGGTATTATTAPPPPRTGNERYATAGTYTYNRTRDGSPTQGTLVVHAPENGDQRMATTWPGGEASEAVVRPRPGAVDLVMLKTTTPLLGTKEFRPSPPVLFAPDPAAVGATWSWRMTSTDGGRTLEGSFTVARTERLDIGGESVDTVVVEGTVQVSGDVVGTLHQTTWVAPKYRLAVRIDERFEGAFRYRQSATLASTRPA